MIEEVEVTVTAVLLEVLEIQPEAIVPTARFVEDLQATSIDLVEIIAVLQNTFDVISLVAACSGWILSKI